MNCSSLRELKLLQMVHLPIFEFQEDVLFINGEGYSLERCPLGKRLIIAFLESSSGCVSRNDLISYVYEVSNLIDVSQRLQNALHQNLNKLISRVRIRLERHYNREYDWIDFFIYEASVGGWSFYRVKTSLLLNNANTDMPLAS